MANVGTINNNKISYINNSKTNNIINFQNYVFEPKAKTIIVPSILVLFIVIAFSYLSGVVVFGGGSYKHPDGTIRTENTISPDVVTDSVEFFFGAVKIISDINIADDVAKFIGSFAEEEVEGELVDFADNWFTRFLQKQINKIRDSMNDIVDSTVDSTIKFGDTVAKWWRDLLGLDENG